jgi:hypothetical protein
VKISGIFSCGMGKYKINSPQTYLIGRRQAVSNWVDIDSYYEELEEEIELCIWM